MPEPIKSLYERLTEAGCILGSYQSDLHVLATSRSKEVIRAFEAEGGISNQRTFTSAVDGAEWIDLPFAYDPWWEERCPASPVDAPAADV